MTKDDSYLCIAVTIFLFFNFDFELYNFLVVLRKALGDQNYGKED